MLWDAGQQRIGRESRERLVERFTAARDAHLDVLVTTGSAKARGTWRLPAYARSDQPQELRSPAERDRALLQLGIMFPGIVRFDA